MFLRIAKLGIFTNFPRYYVGRITVLGKRDICTFMKASNIGCIKRYCLSSESISSGNISSLKLCLHKFVASMGGLNRKKSKNIFPWICSRSVYDEMQLSNKWLKESGAYCIKSFKVEFGWQRVSLISCKERKNYVACKS